MVIINDYDVGAIFQEIEIELIKSMNRTFLNHVSWEYAEGYEWEQWQAKKIREIRKFRAQNQAIMSSYSRRLDKATKTDLNRQFMEGGKKIDNEVAEAIKKGFKLIKGTPSDDFFQGNNEKLNRLIKAINKDLKEAKVAALRQMDDVYRRTIFKTEVFLGSGATTVKKAIDMATKDFLAAGINCIKYADGKNVNIASYARMAVRTANKRVYLMGEGERRKEWGISTVLVSQYSACSPLCLPWQGKVYIDDVYSGGTKDDGEYPLLSTAISGHLFHPNCKHTMSTFFEGISEEPELLDREEIGKAYQKAQREAVINQNIQKYRRLKEGSQDPENVIKYTAKVKEWEYRKKLFEKGINDGIINSSNEIIRIPQIPSSTISKKIDSGEYSIRLSKQQYNKHIDGTKQYKDYYDSRLAKGGNPQSILTISEDKAQEIINKKAGSGIIRVDRLGNARPVESIVCSMNIGKYYANGQYHDTKKASIHYGKNGAHLVPIRGDDYD